MKISEQYIKQLIKEEIKQALSETVSATDPHLENMKMAWKFLSDYERADRNDILPGNFFVNREDRIQILSKARAVADGSKTVSLSQEEIESFWK